MDSSSIKTELGRKGVHVAGLIFIPILYYSPSLLFFICLLCIPIYMLEEKLAAQKISLGGLIPLIQKCKRAEEQKTFIWDPIYMWLGVAITAMLFPLPVAATSLMQVSLGDAAAALVGMQWGTYKVPWNTQKSWEGSFAFFLTAFLGSLCFVAWWQALIAALVGALIEQVPLKSADNFLIPVGVSLVLVLFI